MNSSISPLKNIILQPEVRFWGALTGSIQAAFQSRQEMAVSIGSAKKHRRRSVFRFWLVKKP